MGLFDHLFKNRPEGADERNIEERLKGSPASRAGTDDPDPQTAFLQPKGYAPGATNPAIGGQKQGFVPVLPTARRPAKNSTGLATPGAAAAAAANEILLVFGDVLPRIPVQFLRPGPHDLKRPLRFHLEDLTSDLARGRTGVALSRVAEQCPDFFLHSITDDDDMEVRLPLQKLVEQVARIRAKPSATQRISFAPSPPKTPPPREAPKAKLPPTQPAVAIPSPVEKKEEPKIEPPAPGPTAELVAPPPAPAEPAQEIASTQEVVEPTAHPAEIPPDAEVSVEALAPPPHEPPVPVNAPELVAEETVRQEITEIAPEPQTAPIVSENSIDLSLAAITAAVPIEMLVAGRPQIAESHRISLPFAPIERQLGTGRVEVSGDVFWHALPPTLRHCFVLRSDLSVPLPLEEIFQNLPIASDRPRFEPVVVAPPALDAEAPFILAPAALAEDRTEPLNFDARPETVSTDPAKVESAPEAEAPEFPIVAKEGGMVAEVAAEPVELPVSDTLADQIATPAEGGAPLAVSLPPFRIFTPQVQASEAADRLEASDDRPIFLGQSDAAGAHELIPSESLNETPAPVQPTAAEPEKIDAANEVEATQEAPEEPEPAGVKAAESPAVMPALPSFSDPDESRQATCFSVLPAREVAAVREEASSVVAFSADQPPPLIVESPAVAVAILHATIPAPQQAAISAGPSISVQPPRMFRPIVLPPPITGHAAAPINLAPTLGGPPPTEAGTISLALAPTISAPRFDTPPLPAEPSKVVEPPAVIAKPPAEIPIAAKASEQLVPPAPSTPPAAFAVPAPLESSKPAPVSIDEKPTLHLNIPPLSGASTAASAHEPTLPALALSRFDQHSLQSLFMTDETLDIPKVARLAALLPGIEACVVTNRGESITGGHVPAGFELAALRGLAPQVGAAADRLPIGALKNFTLFGADFSVSFFESGPVCLCVIHRARSFVPGVREKLVAVTEELAR